MVCSCGRPSRTTKSEVCNACRVRISRASPLGRANNQRRVREWRVKYPDKLLLQRLRPYNLSLEQYIDLVTKQKGVCAICKSPPTRARLDIDHNHTTGKIRGLLCNKCNITLGKFEDNPTVLIQMGKYLQDNNEIRD